MSLTIVWFRQDLRLQDNPALQAAVSRGAPILPVYIHDDAGEWGWVPGAASRWWLHHSLEALAASLVARGSRLVLGMGDAQACLREWARSMGADAVYWNIRYELSAVARDGWVEGDLMSLGLTVRTFNAALLHEPHAVANKQGRPFQVFSPYWRHCMTLPVAQPVNLKDGPLSSPLNWPPSLELEQLALLPSRPWAAGFSREWQPGEAGAAQRLRQFVSGEMDNYGEARDAPGENATSRLSPHLHFGEIGPRQIWSAVRKAARGSGVFPPSRGAAVFLKEIGWREFAHHVLFNFPHTPELPLREEFARMSWAPDPDGAMLRAWQRGRTGYPIVDAAMRQLWAIGWMHNRARMIVASFLVKHLRLSWRQGAAWFWDTLVDANLANNTLGWQWSAGCGADAAPYFRIFAPVVQAKRFDPNGDYVRRWVPELSRLSNRHLHSPWEASVQELADAGVTLGETYPRPIVDHATARDAALAAFHKLRGAATP